MDLDVHLSAIRAGDAEAFGPWLAGAEPLLRASLRSFAATADTEAVLQEALLRVWQVAPRVREDGRPNALLRLALRIARNAAIDETRRRVPIAVDPAELPEEVVEPALPDPHLRDAVADCRKQLPRAPASALQARLDAAGGQPDSALARRLGMSLNTFLQNVTRARAALRDCLGKKGIALEVP